MAFNQDRFAPIGGNASPSPAIYTYLTSDSLSDVSTVGYFTDKDNSLEEGDIIIAVISGSAYLMRVGSDTSTVDNTVPMSEAGGLLAGDRLVITRDGETLSLDPTLVLDQNFRGVFPTEAALNAAIPTGNSGDYAIVDDSGAADATMFIWDEDGSAWLDTGFTAIVIADNLTTNDPTQALAASQGVVIKALIDGVDDTVGLISGIISGFDVTVNGGDAAKIDIAAGVGTIIDWSTGSKVITPIVFAGLTAVTITDIASELFTSLYIDDNGDLQQEGGALLSNSTIRQNIVIDAVVHNDFATITNIAVNAVQAYQYGNALFDYVRKLGPINDGNGYSSGGANLSIAKSAGTTTLPWINRDIDPQDPTTSTNAVISPLTATDWSAFYQDGSSGFTVEVGKTVTDPELWDDGSGTLTAVANNRFTIKRFYFFGQNNQTVSTYGQAEYQSLVAAEAAIFTEAPLLSPLLATGTFVTALIVKKGVTNLTTAVAGGDAKFVNITSQTSAAAGGAGAQDLQNTYDLSTDPEILTDSTRGALSIQQGSGADTDDIIEGKNGAGTQTSAITGAGDATFANILVSNTTPASQMLDTNASVDEGFWETTAVNNKLRHRTRDDTGANGVIYHVVTRSGTTVLTQEFLQGRVLIDDTTDATTITDGSLQTDGGLSVVKDGIIGGAIRDFNKIGVIEMKGSNTLPKFSLWCDGAAVSRTTYADLFADIGTTWGVGDGSTTFNLPDFNSANRFPRGNSTAGGTGGSATHVNTVGPINGTTDGPSATVNKTAFISGAVASANHNHTFTIAQFNSGSANHEPPYNNVRYFIWY